MTTATRPIHPAVLQAVRRNAAQAHEGREAAIQAAITTTARGIVLRRVIARRIYTNEPVAGYIDEQGVQWAPVRHALYSGLVDLADPNTPSVARRFTRRCERRNPRQARK
jgi:hypothetical protein